MVGSFIGSCKCGPRVRQDERIDAITAVVCRGQEQRRQSRKQRIHLLRV
jgi:hypothetical protein